MVKLDPEIVLRSPVILPVYLTETVWRRYVEIPEEFKGIQDMNARIGDMLFMFAYQAKKCSGSVLKFKFTCQIPKSRGTLTNETKSEISFQHREVELKAVITAQDIDDPKPAIFIMLPLED